VNLLDRGGGKLAKRQEQRYSETHDHHITA
jgi:hypothetical protein